jgi:hypothetical protein
MPADGVVTVEDRDSGRSVTARFTRVGEDLVVAVSGGERPHVGCVVLATPNPVEGEASTRSASCSVLTIPPHKEEPIARGIATLLAQRLDTVAVVTAGVHEDGLDRAGIEDFLRLGERLGEELVRQLQDQG